MINQQNPEYKNPVFSADPVPTSPPALYRSNRTSSHTYFSAFWYIALYCHSVVKHVPSVPQNASGTAIPFPTYPSGRTVHKTEARKIRYPPGNSGLQPSIHSLLKNKLLIGAPVNEIRMSFGIRKIPKPLQRIFHPLPQPG